MPSFVSRIRALCRNLFRRTAVEQELSDELAQAFEFLVQTKVRDGTSTSEARRLAAIELGGVEQLKEEIREVRAGYDLEALFQDVRFGLRMLLKTPGFTVVAVVTLGLSIGANTAIFSLVNGVLLRPLPFPDAQRIIYIEGKNPAAGISESNISFLDFTDWSQQTDLFASTAAYWTGEAHLGADGAEPERVPRAGVTTGFFSLLGVQPVLGRAFVPEDDKGWPQTVAIISHGLWKGRFGSDPAIVGKQVQMSAMPLTIIGVMPPGFEYPDQTQIWVTSAVNLSEEPRDNRVWSAIARLNAGIDLTQAQTRLSAINAQLDKQFHETNNGWDVSLSTLQERLVREVKPSPPRAPWRSRIRAPHCLCECSQSPPRPQRRAAKGNGDPGRDWGESLARSAADADREHSALGDRRVCRACPQHLVNRRADVDVARRRTANRAGRDRLSRPDVRSRRLGAYRHCLRHRPRASSLEARRHQRIERRRT